MIKRPVIPLNGPEGVIDRKSTRLNSSHLVISYAVFCLKKKTTEKRSSRPAAQRAGRARVRLGRGRPPPRLAEGAPQLSSPAYDHPLSLFFFFSAAPPPHRPPPPPRPPPPAR